MYNQEINIYCDESCHLLHELEKTMIVSCTFCPKSEVKKISEDIRNLKRKHKIWRYAEIKWTKVSKSKEQFYFDLLEYFLKNKNICFRTIKIPDKTILKHDNFVGQNHNSWYYKMIYILVKYIIKPEYNYNIYIDKKENSFESRVALQTVKKILEKHFCKEFSMQNILSHESELMQLNDFLQGIVSYYNRKDHIQGTLNKTKINLINYFISETKIDLAKLNNNKKYNIFIWRPRK